MTPTRARADVLLAAVLFSTGGAAIKVAAFNAAQVSALRSGIAALALLVIFGRRLAWSRRTWAVGVVYAATLTLFVAATKLTTAANAIFLQATAPLYLLLLGPWLLRERVSRRDVTYLVVVGLGTFSCFLGQSDGTATAPDPSLGNLLGVASSIVWALTLVGLRHLDRESTDAPNPSGRPEPEATLSGLAAVVAGNTIACVAALPWALPLPKATVGEWSTIVYLGVVQIALAYVFLTSAMRRLPALEVSLLLLLEPVLNPMWTWAIRGERPGGWTIVGGALILSATAAKSVWDAREGGNGDRADRGDRGSQQRNRETEKQSEQRRYMD